MNDVQSLKELRFVGSSRDDIREFPDPVKQDIGYALFIAQQGGTTPAAKPLKGFGGAGVVEIVENFDGNAYRAVYTVKFRSVVCVLHCFQKKSKRGSKTPKKDMDLIRARLKWAEADYRQNDQ